MLVLLLSLGAAAAVAAPSAAAPAGQAAAQCPASPASLPPDLSGWRNRPARNGQMQPGRPRDLTLAPVREPDPGYAGEAPLIITRAGTYRIVLSDRAWLDVLKGDAALSSDGHAHGPPCSGIRKIVTFQLVPGTYRVRVSRSPVAQVRIMLAAD
ncbi:MAG: hypothetical protein KGL54_12560 [Sphingomonadales bacterium]|nr:hypothetical protein [Sphingomonadales bacterium]